MEEEEEEVVEEPEEGDLGEAITKLTQLSGIGTSKAEALFEAGFTNYDSIRSASVSDLTQVSGISENLAKSVKKQLKSKKFKD